MMRNFLKDQDGATSIEYALIASIIFFAILGGVGAVAGGLEGLFAQVETGFDSPAP